MVTEDQVLIPEVDADVRRSHKRLMWARHSAHKRAACGYDASGGANPLGEVGGVGSGGRGPVVDPESPAGLREGQPRGDPAEVVGQAVAVARQQQAEAER